jgi:beta-lactamase regulating signal transducer with metallopeptidase domain/biopolymer transport protein ExbD
MIGLLNDWGASWGGWFLSAVVQNTLFLVLVLMALFILRRASARVLAAVATVGVVKLAIPPFVSISWFGAEAERTLADPVAPLLFPFSESSGTELGVVADLTGGLHLATVLMLAWASIASARIGWALLQYVQLYVELRRSRPVPQDEIPAEMQGQGLDVRLSERTAFPLTMGLFNRRILVPEVWNRWSPTDRAAVLKHELAHIRRRDNLVQPVEVLVQAVFFFHPLVTWLIGRLRVWREMACDDLSVGRDPHQRLAYSQFLVDFAETVLERGPTAESASMLARRRCELMKRVSYQVKEGIMHSVSKTRLVLVIAALLLAFLPLSLVYGDDPPPPPKKSDPAATTAATAAPAAPAAPAQSEKEVKGDKPPAPEAPPPPPPSVQVGLSAKGLTVNGKKTSKAEFSDAVAKASQEKGGKVVVSIDSDGGVTMGKIHRMQSDLKDLGLIKVVYTGELGEAVPMVLPPDKARKKLQSLPEDQILKVKVDAAGVVTVGGKKIAGEDLPKLIQKKMDKEPYLVVVLNTENETKYGAFLQTLQGLRKGGADKIAIQDPGK